MQHAWKSSTDVVRWKTTRDLSMVIAAVTTSMVLVASPASAINLVINPGFETGDLTGWTLSGNVGLTGAFCPGPGEFVSDGSCSAFFGSVGTSSTLMQALPTTPGTAYSISFWALLDDENPNSFSALFGSTPLISVTNGAGVLNFSLPNLVATGAFTTLTFNFRDDPSFIFFDAVNVSVAEPAFVSEPASLAVLSVGLAGIGFSRRRGK